MNTGFQTERNKNFKMEKTLEELGKEISNTVAFLKFLKSNSRKLVKKLNAIQSPRLYLKEFVNTNKILLEYVSLLTEINCRIEMYAISKNKFTSANFLSDNPHNDSVLSNVQSINFSNQDLLKVSEPVNIEEDRIDKELVTSDLKLKEFNYNRNSILYNSQQTESIEIEKAEQESNNLTCYTQLLNKSNAQSKCSLDFGSLDDYSSEQSCNCNHLQEQNIKTRTEDIISNRERVNEESQILTAQSSNLKSLDKTRAVIENSVSLNDNTETKLYFGEKKNQSDESYDSLLDVVDSIEDKTGKTAGVDESIHMINNNNFGGTLTKIFDNISEKLLGSEFEVLVEHIESPSEFYVYLPDLNTDLLKELRNKLKAIPAKDKIVEKCNLAKKKLLCKEIGSSALFYSFCDESWYRAYVKDWGLQFDDEYVSIFVLDTGESKCVSADYLQAMPFNLTNYPLFIQKCYLSNICSINIDEKRMSKKWMKNSTEQMWLWIETSQKIIMKIVSEDINTLKNQDALPVLLWYVDDNGSKNCINDLLVEMDMAEYLVKPVEAQRLSDNNSLIENLSLEQWNPMKEDFESCRNSYDLNLNNPSAAIYGYVGKDYERICFEFGRTGKCYKGYACRKEHVILNPLGFTTDKEEVYKSAFNSFPKPDIGETFNVSVTCVVKVNSFYCILNNENRSLQEETLDTLVAYMNKPRNIEEMKKVSIPPSIGQVVVAKYSTDNAWYRAKVLYSDPEGNVCRVLFVDYGNKETILLNNIRIIEPKYLHLPFQAIKCLIYGIEGISQEGMLYFINRIENKNIYIKVESVYPGEDTCWLVQVYDDKNTNIGEELITKEFAVRKKSIIFNKNSEILPG